MATTNAINNTSNPVRSTGISFDGTNTLSTYTNTTSYTPTVQFAGGNTGITYGTQTGYWSRLGNVVYFYAAVGLTSKGSSTGAFQLNLPVAAAYDSAAAVIIAEINVSRDFVTGWIVGGGQIMYFRMSGLDSETNINLSDALIENTTSFIVAGTYFV